MKYKTKKYLVKVKRIVDNVIELLERNLENINNNALTDEQKKHIRNDYWKERECKFCSFKIDKYNFKNTTI